MTGAPIRFYGRRKGHALSAAQRRLVDELLPELAVADDGEIDLGALFPSAQTIWLEIGFGKGEHLAWQAARHPEIGFIGCEPYINGVAGLLAAIARDGLKNTRIFAEDARLLLPRLPPASISCVFLLHPDPWHKWRHAKRRFVSPENLDQLARIMTPGAELRISTDDATYCRWTLLQMLARKDFAWAAERADDWRHPPEDWLETRYAAKAQREGRSPVYLSFERVVL